MELSKKPTVCIVGLGYVGLPLAIEFGKKFDVIGLDIDKTKIEELKRGFDRMGEVEQSDLESVDVQYTSNPKSLKDATVIIVAVPTPIDSHKRPDLTILKKASEMVGKHMPKDCIVVFESTVFPGATQDICQPILEKESGFKEGKDFLLGYSPERVNPGDKNRTIPKIVKVVAASSPAGADYLEWLYGSIVTAGTHKAPTIRTAEAAKVIENVQRDLNIALVNELSILFDTLGINVHDVLEAAGTKWNFHMYTPGLVGGHCIGVDPYYLTHKAEEVGHHPDIILAGRRLNDDMHKHYAALLVKKLNNKSIPAKDAKVAVLGLTFKENCSDYRNSRSKHLVHELKQYGCKVFGVDPWLDDATIELLGATPLDLEDMSAEGLDAVVVVVPHKEFFDADFSSIPVFVDIKGRLSKS